jgi:hypothetical protein
MTIPGPVPPRDLDWIHSQLQLAVELECSTLPLYLAALFSLEVQNYTAYNQIRSVAMEEMVHMAIAANMLSALGGSPRIKGIKPAFPAQGLTGGVEPDLRVGLAKLSKPQLVNFLRIEEPAFLLEQRQRDAAYPTIASFYRAIRDAIQANADAVRAAAQKGGPSNQVGDDIGFTVIKATGGVDPVAQLLSGLDEILEQGEGTSSATLLAGDGSEGELSHYAKFATLYYGRDYQAVSTTEITPETEPLFFRGRTLLWPKVINTLAVPSDGYAKLLALDPASAAVAKDLTAFDSAYSGILAGLDVAWNGPADGSWKTLGGTVDVMMHMRVLSCFNIIRHEVPGALVAQLGALYPDEAAFLSTYTDVSQPVFYGPRFANTNV